MVMIYKTLFFFLFFLNGFISNSQIKNRSNVDERLEKIDFSNTICDTLFLDNKIILLENSPLLLLHEIKALDLVHENKNPNSDIFNCSRGFTASWELIGNKLYLKKINLRENVSERLVKILKSKKFLKESKNPVDCIWVSGNLVGGEDAIRTKYGYAFKNEYRFSLENGLVVNKYINTFPVGTLENEISLNSFMQDNKNALLNVINNLETLKRFKNDKTEGGKLAIMKTNIPLIITDKGENYYLPTSFSNQLTIQYVSDRSDLPNRVLISHINLVNMLPIGSFYPRFLRNGIVLNTLNIDYSWNLINEIFDVSVAYNCDYEINSILGSSQEVVQRGY